MGMNYGTLVAGAVARAGLTPALMRLSHGWVSDRTGAIAAGAAILAVVVALLASFAGGYVAGRMSRYDGARQGRAVWVFTLFGAVLAAAAAAVLGHEFGLFDHIDPGAIPIDERIQAAGAVIALFFLALGTRATAVLGGRGGNRYHERVDRFGRGAA